MVIKINSTGEGGKEQRGSMYVKYLKRKKKREKMRASRIIWQPGLELPASRRLLSAQLGETPTPQV